MALLAKHVEAEAILSLVDVDNVRPEDPPLPSSCTKPTKNFRCCHNLHPEQLASTELVSTILEEGGRGMTP